jgi:hypothetical protein
MAIDVGWRRPAAQEKMPKPLAVRSDDEGLQLPEVLSPRCFRHQLLVVRLELT